MQIKQSRAAITYIDRALSDGMSFREGVIEIPVLVKDMTMECQKQYISYAKDCYQRYIELASESFSTAGSKTRLAPLKKKAIEEIKSNMREQNPARYDMLFSEYDAVKLARKASSGSTRMKASIKVVEGSGGNLHGTGVLSNTKIDKIMLSCEDEDPYSLG